jgi:hypothetical protein
MTISTSEGDTHFTIVDRDATTITCSPDIKNPQHRTRAAADLTPQFRCDLTVRV